MAHVTLILVHGRAQQGQDPKALKQQWLDVLRLGLGRRRSAILDDVDVVFPYYGDLLDKFLREMQDSIPEDIVVRGDPDGIDAEYRSFHAEFIEGVKQQLKLEDAQIEFFIADEVRERGPLNWEWVQALLRAADVLPGVSARAIQGFTRDVFIYLNRSLVRKAVNAVVDAALPSGRTVVIAHSLGSVVAYDVLTNLERKIDIPLLVTVGSPLGVGPIRRTLAPLRFPGGVASWFNALDTRDVVALYQLDATTFPITPLVENYAGVRNGTENAHGIAGYLNDPIVAERIYKALVLK
jgi:hypothetical protein